MDKSLTYLANQLEKDYELAHKVKGAMTYPIAVLVISFTVVALLLLKVIPVFKKMFEGMGGQLPGPTAFLVAASEFTQHYFLYMIAVLVVIYIVFVRFYKTEKGRWIVDKFAYICGFWRPFMHRFCGFSRRIATKI